MQRLIAVSVVWSQSQDYHGDVTQSIVACPWFSLSLETTCCGTGGGGSGDVGWVWRCCMDPVKEMAMLLVKRGNTYASSLVILATLEKE